MQPDRDGHAPRGEHARVGDGMWGMAVPSNWEIADAETYAVMRYLRKVVIEAERDGKDVAKQRVLVLSDCQAALQMIEAAWRRDDPRVPRRASCAAILEELCAHRRRLGTVVTMWVPGHRGVSANEYTLCRKSTRRSSDPSGRQ